MRTVVSEFDTLGSDLGFDTIPHTIRANWAPVRVEAPTRPVADRRPCKVRPRSGVVSYGHARVRRDRVVVRAESDTPRGRRSLSRMQRAQAGFAALAVAALVSALAVTGLIALAQLRSGDFGSQTVPSEIAPALPR
ncbi:hypothetical protein HLB23_38980 [Nocardia uniformis]|uniref:Uncharacterized protein n=1 Tax=Nocardia uniformis TaxID=53432 RepID=A0A849CKT5_9NOCA|nr:hypothetical protein [Nocardia uniformis]NNH75771.1 hypothetical protein [Nocardia uniformis]